MSTEQFANFAQTTLNGAITSGATSLTVASVFGFPVTAQYRILVDSELMIVTGGAGSTTWTVSRGAEGTATASHNSGATVTLVLTAGALDNLDASQIATGVLSASRIGAGVNAQTGTSYTLTDSDRGMLVTFNNASAVAVTLPQAGSGGQFSGSWLVDVENRGAGAVTVTPTASTIDGATSLVLQQNQGVRVYSDGTNYFTQRGVGASNPMTALGDLIYGGTAGAETRLAGDTSNVRKFLRTQASGGVAQAPAWDTVDDTDVVFSDVTTGNVSTSEHGFTPKAPGDATKFLDGTGAYSVPGGVSLPTVGCFMGGRLTLTSGTWLTTSDVTAATTLYYTPGGNVSGGSNTWLTSNGTTISVGTFTEKSLKLTDSSQTGNWSNAAKTITGLTSTAQLVRGMQVTGTNIAANSTIASIDSATQVTLNNTPTGTGTGAAITFKLPPSTVYDVYNVGGTLQFGNAWTNTTTRADALGTLGGVTVNNAVINSGDSNSIAAKAGIYLGTICTTATAGQTSDSAGGVTTQVGGQRFVWNTFNRRQRPITVVDKTSSWSYSSTTWRQADGAAGNRVECVIGLAEDVQSIFAYSCVSQLTNAVGNGAGIGIDSTTVNSSAVGSRAAYSTTANISGLTIGVVNLILPIGYHAINWLEHSINGQSVTFSANDPNPGLLAVAWG